MKKVIAKIRQNKTNKQKVVTIPKQEETKDWNEDDFVEIKKVELK